MELWESGKGDDEIYNGEKVSGLVGALKDAETRQSSVCGLRGRKAHCMENSGAGLAIVTRY